MSLHSTYDEKERHCPVSRETRVPDQCGFFEVGSESLKTSFPATGAAYEPFKNFRQQLFFDFFRMIRCPSKIPVNNFFRFFLANQKPSKFPAPQRLTQPLEVRSDIVRRCCLAGEAPKCSLAGSGHLGGGL